MNAHIVMALLLVSAVTTSAFTWLSSTAARPAALRSRGSGNAAGTFVAGDKRTERPSPLPHAAAPRTRVCTLVHAAAMDGERPGNTADALAVLSLPREPSPSLSADDTVFAVIKGLQFNDVPALDAGLERLYYFCDLYCRSAITARQGAKSIEKFKEFAESPAFRALIRAERWEASTCHIIEAPKDSPTRGDYAVCIVTVLERKGFRFPSGLERQGEEGEDNAPFTPVVTQFKLTLEKQRRPPLTGCWLLHECVLAKDEFLYNGDTGGTTTD